MALTAITRDGLTLNAETFGPQDAPMPVICLPGLTRNARDFTALAEALSVADASGPAMRVIVMESRGRGGSQGSPGTYTLPQELDDLQVALDAWGIGRARFVGTSRGGLLTMGLAMVAPDRIESAVLNDIGPVIEESGLARIGKAVGARMEFASFDALADALERAIGAQFPRLDAGGWLRLARQLASPTGEGTTVRYDYDASLGDTFRTDGPSGPLPDLWPAFDALAARPVMVVHGALSDILSAATVEAMRQRDADLETLVIEDEGHAPLLWDANAIDPIKRFLAASAA